MCCQLLSPDTPICYKVQCWCIDMLILGQVKYMYGTYILHRWAEESLNLSEVYLFSYHRKICEIPSGGLVTSEGNCVTLLPLLVKVVLFFPPVTQFFM
jgi:hypothetical protein